MSSSSVFSLPGTQSFPKIYGLASEKPSKLVIKFGGSLFSDKSLDQSLDREAIADYARLVANLSKSHPGRIVFITGGGAIGHGALRNRDKSDPFGSIVLTKALADVRWEWSKALHREKVKALPLQLGAMSVLDSEGNFSAASGIVRKVMENGVLPVLSGDSVLDQDGNLHGLSSDRVPEFLVQVLDGPLRVVSFTDVPGILLDGPGGEDLLDYVDPAAPDRAYAAIWKKSNWDATGALKGKLDSLLSCASSGAECFIMKGSTDPSDYRYLFSPYREWPEGVRSTRIAIPDESR